MTDGTWIRAERQEEDGLTYIITDAVLDDGITDGKWHHVALAWDDAISARPQLFVDGVKTS